jgi:hypothetical protein
VDIVSLFLEVKQPELVADHLLSSTEVFNALRFSFCVSVIDVSVFYREEKQKERDAEAHKRWLQERQEKKVELERAWKPPGM